MSDEFDPGMARIASEVEAEATTPDAICEELDYIAHHETTTMVVGQAALRARDLIQQQQATIKRLSAALEGIISETGDRGDGLIDWQRCVDRIQDRARAALGKDASDDRSPGSSEGE